MLGRGIWRAGCSEPRICVSQSPCSSHLLLSSPFLASPLHQEPQVTTPAISPHLSHAAAYLLAAISTHPPCEGPPMQRNLWSCCEAEGRPGRRRPISEGAEDLLSWLPSMFGAGRDIRAVDSCFWGRRVTKDRQLFPWWTSAPKKKKGRGSASPASTLLV